MECFGIPRTKAQARGAEMWLELCRQMARELPETAAQAMRCYERFAHQRGNSRSWEAMHDALRPVMDSDIPTHMMFGLAPWGHAVEFATQMAWRFQTAFPPLPGEAEGAAAPRKSQ